MHRRGELSRTPALIQVVEVSQERDRDRELCFSKKHTAEEPLLTAAGQQMPRDGSEPWKSLWASDLYWAAFDEDLSWPIR